MDEEQDDDEEHSCNAAVLSVVKVQDPLRRHEGAGSLHTGTLATFKDGLSAWSPFFMLIATRVSAKIEHIWLL